MAIRTVVTVSIAALLLWHALSASPVAAPPPDDDDDLSLFEEDDEPKIPHPAREELEDLDKNDDWDDPLPLPLLADDKDVVVLNMSNFSQFVRENRYVMVEFYAAWCGYCQEFAKEYAEAATALKETGILLAKVDVTVDRELAQEYEVQVLPTVFFFVDGVHKSYSGKKTKDAILNYIQKQLGPGIHNITTIEDAQKILSRSGRLVVAFLDSLVGLESQELAAASKLEDDLDFYQTSNPEVAELFHISPEAKRPSLVLLKQEAEKLNYFDGQFEKDAIFQFVLVNKLPLVIRFSKEGLSQIMVNPIKKLVMLCAPSNDSVKILPVFEDAAKLFKGKLIFVYLDTNNEDFGQSVSQQFGVYGSISVVGFVASKDPRKYKVKGDITFDNIKTFAESFLEDGISPYYKSSPVPESNDGDVKIVVGDNFDEIVLDESKDVLLEIYSPYCKHCQALEPIYNKLAKRLRGIESLVIAKLDGTTNENPRAKAEGFPTLLFFPAGKKSSDPVTAKERTALGIYKFIKKHASIPFKLQKSSSYAKSEGGSKNSSKDAEKEIVFDEVKDEL